jgi:hypothetical protein
MAHPSRVELGSFKTSRYEDFQTAVGAIYEMRILRLPCPVESLVSLRAAVNGARAHNYACLYLITDSYKVHIGQDYC